MRPVARGGMAEVYEVEDPTSGERLALKLLVQAGSALPRFNREYEALTRLNHPSIVRVYHYGIHDGQPWLTMEFLDGKSPQACVKALGRPGTPVRTQEVLRLGYHIAEALDYIHERGLVHRDLKSSNVVVLPDGRVKVVDFGTAHLRDPIEVITREGEFVGTFAYASPEQIQGHALDWRSDLYSLGVLLYRLATGRRPFNASSSHALAVQHITEDPIQPTVWVPTLAPRLAELILWLMAKDATARPPRAKAVSRILEDLSSSPFSMGTGLQVSITRPLQRNHERLGLVANLEQARPGEMSVVVGNAGSGRERFTQTTAGEFRDTGWRVFHFLLRRDKALACLAEALKHAAAGIDQTRSRTGSSLLESIDQVLAQDNLLRSDVRALLLKIGPQILVERAKTEDVPLMLVIQQLHRAGPATLELLQTLRRHVAKAAIPVIFLASTDPSLLLDEERRERLDQFNRVDLRALTAQRTNLAVGQLLHRRPPPAEIARAVFAASGGQPLYVEHVVRRMVKEGTLRGSGSDGNRIDWGKRPEFVRPPGVARRRIRSMLRGLPAPHRRVLEALAVWGGGLSVAVAALSLDYLPEELSPILDDLISGGWIERSHDELTLHDRLAQPLVLADLAPTRHHVLVHALAANLLSAAPSPDKVRMLVEIDQIHLAARDALEAAGALLHEGSPRKALEVLEPLIDTATGRLHTDSEALLHLLHATALMAVSPTDPRLGRSLQRAEDTAEDPDLRIRVGLARARLQWVIGHYPSYRRHLLHAWEAISESTNPELVSRVASHLGFSHLWSGQPRTAGEWFQRSRSTAEDHPHAAAHADIGMATFLLAQGQVTRAEVVIVDAMNHFQRSNSAAGFWRALVVWTDTLRQQGRFSEALALLYQRLPAARESQVPSHYVRLLLATARCELDLLRLGRAQECVDELEATIRRGEHLHLRLQAALVRGRIEIESGMHIEAANTLMAAHRRARSAELAVTSESARVMMAEAMWALGEKEEARELFQAAILGLLGSGDLASLAIACVSRARALAEELPPSELFKPVETIVARQPMILIRLEQLLATARWHAAQGDRERSSDSYRMAATALNRIADNLNDTDRAALRVHPWSMRIRRGLK